MPPPVQSSCLVSALRIKPEVVHDCGTTIANGVTCTLPEDVCIDESLVRSFECIAGNWQWVTPPLFCIKWGPLCEWSPTSLNCDGTRVNSSLAVGYDLGNLDPRFTRVSFVHFPTLGVNIYAFDGLTQLQYLNLSNNNQQFFTGGSMSGLYTLDTIDMSNNQLSTLNEYSFPPSGRVKYIDLRGNVASIKQVNEYTLRTPLEFCRNATGMDKVSTQPATDRVLLMDDDACVMKGFIVEQPPAALYCEQLVCNGTAEPALTLSCSMESKEYRISSICDGVKDCANGEDEDTLCQKVDVAAISLPDNVELCDSIQMNFGKAMQTRNGLAIMNVTEDVSPLFADAGPLLMWQYKNLTHAYFQLSNERDSQDVIKGAKAEVIVSDNVFELNFQLMGRVSDEVLHCLFNLSIIGLSVEPTTTSTSTTTAQSSTAPANDVMTRTLPASAAIGIALAGGLFGLAVLVVGLLICRRRTRDRELVTVLDIQVNGMHFAMHHTS